MAKLSFKSDFAISEVNGLTAISFLTSDWAGIDPSDQNTWKVTSQYIHNDPDGFFNYANYFMGSFMSVNSNVIVFESVQLVSGVLTGYGTGTYGRGTYGTPRTYSGTGNTYPEKANRRWIAILP